MEQSDAIGSDSRDWKAVGDVAAERRWKQQPKRQVLGPSGSGVDAHLERKGEGTVSGLGAKIRNQVKMRVLKRSGKPSGLESRGDLGRGNLSAPPNADLVRFASAQRKQPPELFTIV